MDEDTVYWSDEVCPIHDAPWDPGCPSKRGSTTLPRSGARPSPSISGAASRRAAPADRVALVGYSRGGQVGAIVGGADQRLTVVSLLLAGHFDRSETGHRGAACPANYIGRISPRPLFLLNGEFDSDYDRERSVEPLHRLAGEPKEIVWGEMGHSVFAEHVELLTGWLRGQLQPDG